MNNHIVDSIETFCNNSQNYDIPRVIRVHIIYLNDLAQQWYKSNHPNLKVGTYDKQENELLDQIQKTIVLLIEKISNHQISNNLVQIFSDIVICYMDAIAHNKDQINELINIFNNMVISN